MRQCISTQLILILSVGIDSKWQTQHQPVVVVVDLVVVVGGVGDVVEEGAEVVESQKRKRSEKLHSNTEIECSQITKIIDF